MKTRKHTLRLMLAPLMTLLMAVSSSQAMAGNAFAACTLAEVAPQIQLLKGAIKGTIIACKTGDTAKARAVAVKMLNKGINKANKKVPKLFEQGRCDPGFVPNLDDYPLPAATEVDLPDDFDTAVTACDGEA